MTWFVIGEISIRPMSFVNLGMFMWRSICTNGIFYNMLVFVVKEFKFNGSPPPPEVWSCDKQESVPKQTYKCVLPAVLVQQNLPLVHYYLFQ